MTSRDPPAHAAQIKHAVASSSTCNASTVEALTSLLLNTQANTTVLKPETKAPIRTKPLVSTTKVNRIAPLRTKKASGKAVPEVEVEYKGKEQLEPLEKLKLATEIVNAALRSLTEAIRNSSPQIPLPKRNNVSQKLSASQDVECYTAMSPVRKSRQSKLTNARSNLRTQSAQQRQASTSEEENTGIIAVAQCARVAFNALRALSAKESAASHMAPFQVEMGMSSLVGKLISLGMEDLAIQELRILKRRLYLAGPPERFSGQSKNGMKSTTGMTTTAHTSQTLPDLLDFSIVPDDPAAISLAIASQIQVIKLLAFQNRHKSLEVALQHVQASSPYSPANLVDRLRWKSSTETCNKAARQLEQLVQALVSFCPPCSANDDHLALDAQIYPHPRTVFQCQVLVLQIRRKWWDLLGHQVDPSKDFFGPLTRYVHAFTRRSTAAAESTYEIAHTSVQALIEGPSVNGSKRLENMPVDPQFAEVYDALADFGYNNGLFESARNYLDKVLLLLNESGASHSRIAAVHCRLAGLEVQRPVSSSGVRASNLEKTISVLRGSLSGSSSELDELLLRVSSLRKAVVRVLVDTTEQYAVEYRPYCLSILISSLEFLARYLGKRPEAAADTKPASRYIHRMKLTKAVAIPTIEAMAAVAKLPFANETQNWKKITLALRTCNTLISSFEDLNDPNEQQGDAKRAKSLYVLLSNVYWCRLLNQKSCSSTENSIATLQEAIGLIQDRSATEQETGFLPIKLEKLGFLYENLSQWSKAVDSYKEALNAEINAGILKICAESAAAHSLANILAENNESGVLFRILAAFSRTAQKYMVSQRCKLIIYDDIYLPDAERGLMLEYQLKGLVENSKVLDTSESARDALNELSASLLSIYTREHFPIRRLRVIVSLMSLQTSHHSPNMLEYLELSEVNDTKSLGWDVGLIHLTKHLLERQKAYCALVQPNLTFKMLQPIIEEWSQWISSCSTWIELQSQVDDLRGWLDQLDSIAAWLHLQGHDIRRIPILAIITKIHVARSPSPSINLVSKMAALGLQLSRAGFSEQAGTTLQNVYRHVETLEVPNCVFIQLHMAYAEYLLGIGNVTKCEEFTAKARLLLETAIKSNGPANTADRYENIWASAELSHVLSLLATATNQSPKALFHARISVKLSYRLWAILEHRKFVKAPQSGTAEEAVDTLSKDLSAMTIVEIKSNTAVLNTNDSLKSTAFWPLVPRLFDRLLRLSKLLSHQGLLPESSYYAGQAVKIANAAEATGLQRKAANLLGCYKIGGGEAAVGIKMLMHANQNDDPKSLDDALSQIYLARGHAIQQNHVSEDSAYRAATIILNEQHLGTVCALGLFSHVNSTSLCKKTSTQSLREIEPIQQNTSNKRSKSIIKNPSPLVSRPTTTVSVPSSHNHAFHADLSVTALRTHGELLRAQAQSAMARGSIEAAGDHLVRAGQASMTFQETVEHTLHTAHLLLRRSIINMLTDPVFSILPESTVSCPSQSVGTCRRSKDYSNSVAFRPAQSARLKKKRSKEALKCSKHTQEKQAPEFDKLLNQALEALLTICLPAQTACASSVLHMFSDVLAKTSMMISAACSAISNKGLISSGFTVYAMELARTMAMANEQAVIEVDKIIDSQTSGLALLDEEQESTFEVLTIEYTTFQADFIDIIPENWTAISISINENRDELRLSKLRSGQAPFVLVIPLNRQNSRDVDEEVFGFDQGKSELLDVIDLANFSAHDAGDLSQKGAKSAWWEARAALDARLGDLLVNVENIWLGGFRGIFSQITPRQDLFSRFQQSFYGVLDKYLPSRRKVQRGVKPSRINLDSRVLELFIGLGDVSEFGTLEDPILDLLYFVVDILQFHGERNAYDEIDFDSMTIETIDALMHFDQAFKSTAEVSRDAPHTILILDKSLHCFPWESLPCMAGQAISRLPSLGCLRSRIIKQKAENDAEDQRIPGFHIDSSDGACILNPEGDLTSTEKVLWKPLSRLSNWSSCVNRLPTETEIGTYLSSKSLYLYFGHGSGGQYVRSRTIKRLDKCAVALLMGCSSAKMNEAGEFESYGTPLNYLHAGASAVVGTLWDVTDKDIDRFSMAVLEKWGLFEQRSGSAKNNLDVSPSKKGGSRKGKGKARAEMMENMSIDGIGGIASLDDAVAKARKSCILQYLNGAAPVVYGVPVFLR